MADPTDDKPATGDPTPPTDLGDAGKKALEAERKARRDAEAQLKNLQDELQAIKDRDKSDGEKLAEKLAAAEKRAADAEAQALRLEVAAEKGVKPRWLTGTTREELEAAAEEYLADHPPATGDKPAPAKPAEDLRGGGDPTEDPPVDVRKVVADIPRGF